MKKVKLLLAAAALSLFMTACGGSSASDINWSELKLGEELPKPNMNSITGEIETNDSDSLQVVINKVSKDDFNTYVKLCEDNGFNLDSYSSDEYYSANNSSGYELYISYDKKEKTMRPELNAKYAYGEFTWPDSELSKLLPVPKSNYGAIEWENSDGFVIDVAQMSIDDFNEYVSSCKDNGFTVDYQAGKDFYYADNESGYRITLNYKDGNVMFVRIDAPDEEPTEVASSEEPTEATTEETTSQADTSGIRPEFKEAMDSYEKFFDEYCTFMKKYKESNDASSMLADYTKYMAQYADTMAKLDAIDEKELSTEEAVYYAEVSARITSKLAEVAQ